jgi:radical SAM superfamily enzyme YgiQ (UPF0313 family)
VKTTIISLNRNRTPVPVVPYGACVIAESASRHGHDVRLLDLMFRKNPEGTIAHDLRRHPPDIVGISVRNLDNNDMLKPVEYVSGLVRTTAAVKAATGAPVVLGGSAMAVMPQALLRATGADLGVLGDGETVFPLLLDTFSNGSRPADVPRVACIHEEKYTVSGNGPLPLDPDPGLIAPDYERWINTRAYRTRMAAMPLQSKRGCPFPCVYCTYGAGEGHDYRLYPPSAVVEAVERLTRAGFRDIEFVDNVFNSPLEHAMEICEGIAGSATRARLQTVELNPKFVDMPLLAAMKAAGFLGVGITAESAADPVLEGLAKGYTAADVHNAARAVRKTNLPCLWVFMLGGPGETRDTALETVRFATSMLRGGDAAFFNVGIRIYPDTVLETIARREGLLTAAAGQMIEPAFYFSPELAVDWIMDLLQQTAREHRNVLYSAEALDHPLLPLINRVAGLSGISQPLWRHTAAIRTVLRLLGQDIGGVKRR